MKPAIMVGILLAATLLAPPVQAWGFSSITDPIGDFFEDAYDAAAEGASALGDLSAEAANALSDVAPEVLGRMKHLAGDAWDALVVVLNQIETFTQQLIDDLVAAAESVIDAVGQAVQQAISTALDTMQRLAEEALEAARDGIVTAANVVAEQVADAATLVGETVWEGIVAGCTNSWGPVPNACGVLIDCASSIGSIVGGAVDQGDIPDGIGGDVASCAAAVCSLMPMAIAQTNLEAHVWDAPDNLVDATGDTGFDSINGLNTETDMCSRMATCVGNMVDKTHQMLDDVVAGWMPPQQVLATIEQMRDARESVMEAEARIRAMDHGQFDLRGVPGWGSEGEGLQLAYQAQLGRYLAAMTAFNVLIDLIEGGNLSDNLENIIFIADALGPSIPVLASIQQGRQAVADLRSQVETALEGDLDDETRALLETYLRNIDDSGAVAAYLEGDSQDAVKIIKRYKALRELANFKKTMIQACAGVQSMSLAREIAAAGLEEIQEHPDYVIANVLAPGFGGQIYTAGREVLDLPAPVRPSAADHQGPIAIAPGTLITQGSEALLQDQINDLAQQLYETGGYPDRFFKGGKDLTDEDRALLDRIPVRPAVVGPDHYSHFWGQPLNIGKLRAWVDAHDLILQDDVSMASVTTTTLAIQQANAVRFQGAVSLEQQTNSKEQALGAWQATEWTRVVSDVDATVSVSKTQGADLVRNSQAAGIDAEWFAQACFFGTDASSCNPEDVCDKQGEGWNRAQAALAGTLMGASNQIHDGLDAILAEQTCMKSVCAARTHDIDLLGQARQDDILSLERLLDAETLDVVQLQAAMSADMVAGMTGFLAMEAGAPCEDEIARLQVWFDHMLVGGSAAARAQSFEAGTPMGRVVLEPIRVDALASAWDAAGSSATAWASVEANLTAARAASPALSLLMQADAGGRTSLYNLFGDHHVAPRASTTLEHAQGLAQAFVALRQTGADFAGALAAAEDASTALQAWMDGEDPPENADKDLVQQQLGRLRLYAAMLDAGQKRMEELAPQQHVLGAAWLSRTMALAPIMANPELPRPSQPWAPSSDTIGDFAAVIDVVRDELVAEMTAAGYAPSRLPGGWDPSTYWDETLTQPPWHDVAFVVDASDDRPDVIADGACRAVGGGCTLRAALMEAHGASQPTMISFEVDHVVIESDLPEIRGLNLTIDGAGPDGDVHMQAATPVSGFHIQGDHTTLRRLTMEAFTSHVMTGDDVEVAHNVFTGGGGLVVTGNGAHLKMNQFKGLGPDIGALTIRGDDVTLDKNIFVNNHVHTTLTVTGAGAQLLDNTLRANRDEVGVGLEGEGFDVSGLRVMGGHGVGILLGDMSSGILQASNVTKNAGIGLLADGGTWDVVDNNITANQGGVVWRAGGAPTLEGNRIEGNRGPGIKTSAPESRIEANLLRNNNGPGIWVQSGMHALSGNLIDNSRGLPIDLASDKPDGTNSNDLMDGDGGPNGLTNHPILLAGDDEVEVRLQGAPDSMFEIELFEAACPQPGRINLITSLATATVTTDADGLGTATVLVEATAAMVATATGSDGTSEVSPCASPAQAHILPTDAIGLHLADPLRLVRTGETTSSVTFSAYAPGVDVSQGTWTFSDGTEATGATATHAWTQRGDHHVTWQAEDGSLEASMSVHVVDRTCETVAQEPGVARVDARQQGLRVDANGPPGTVVDSCFDVGGFQAVLAKRPGIEPMQGVTPLSYAELDIGAGTTAPDTWLESIIPLDLSTAQPYLLPHDDTVTIVQQLEGKLRVTRADDSWTQTEIAHGSSGPLEVVAHDEGWIIHQNLDATTLQATNLAEPDQPPLMLAQTSGQVAFCAAPINGGIAVAYVEQVDATGLLHLASSTSDWTFEEVGLVAPDSPCSLTEEENQVAVSYKPLAGGIGYALNPTGGVLPTWFDNHGNLDTVHATTFEGRTMLFGNTDLQLFLRAADGEAPQFAGLNQYRALDAATWHEGTVIVAQLLGGSSMEAIRPGSSSSVYSYSAPDGEPLAVATSNGEIIVLHAKPDGATLRWLSPGVDRFTFTFPYDRDDLAARGVSEASLSAMVWNGTEWRSLRASSYPHTVAATQPEQPLTVYDHEVDYENQVVRVTVDHNSAYGLAASPTQSRSVGGGGSGRAAPIIPTYGPEGMIALPGVTLHVELPAPRILRAIHVDRLMPGTISMTYQEAEATNLPSGFVEAGQAVHIQWPDSALAREATASLGPLARDEVLLARNGTEWHITSVAALHPGSHATWVIARDETGPSIELGSQATEFFVTAQDNRGIASIAWHLEGETLGTGERIERPAVTRATVLIVRVVDESGLTTEMHISLAPAAVTHSPGPNWGWIPLAVAGAVGVLVAVGAAMWIRRKPVPDVVITTSLDPMAEALAEIREINPDIEVTIIE